MDIDALDEQNKTVIRIFGEERELKRLTLKDHVRMSTIDTKMERLDMGSPEDQAILIKDMQGICKGLLPELTDEELDRIAFDHYMWIREAVNDRMMKDRGFSEAEIEKAKKQQKKMILG